MGGWGSGDSGQASQARQRLVSSEGALQERGDRRLEVSAGPKKSEKDRAALALPQWLQLLLCPLCTVGGAQATVLGRRSRKRSLAGLNSLSHTDQERAPPHGSPFSGEV